MVQERGQKRKNVGMAPSERNAGGGEVTLTDNGEGKFGDGLLGGDNGSCASVSTSRCHERGGKRGVCGGPPVQSGPAVKS